MDGWNAKRLWSSIWEVVAPFAIFATLVTAGAAVAPACAALFPDLHRGTADENQSWRGLHRVSGELVVRDAAIRVECGAHVEMGPGATVRVVDGGRLVLEGRPGCPVVWSSGSSDPEPGDWDGVEVDDGGALRARYARFEQGGGGGSILRVDAGGRARLEEVSLQGAAKGGLEVRPGGRLRRAAALSISEVGGDPIRIPAGQLDVLERPTFEETVRRIVAYGGVVRRRATWDFPGVTLQIVGDTRIRARTRIAPETSVHLFPDTSVTVEAGGALRAIGDERLGYGARRRWVRLQFAPESRLRIAPSAGPENLFRWVVAGGRGRIEVADPASVRFRHTRWYGTDCSDGRAPCISVRRPDRAVRDSETGDGGLELERSETGARNERSSGA